MPRLMGLSGETVPVSRRRGRNSAAVAVEQRDVPGDLDAEALVLVAADGEVRAEEDGEVDVGLARDAAEQRRLVLDGVRDDVGEAHRMSRCAEPQLNGYLAAEDQQRRRCRGAFRGCRC